MRKEKAEQEDDVIVVRDELVPRPEWKIARVEAVHHGRDKEDDAEDYSW